MIGPTIQIRELTPEDIPEVRLLLNRSFRDLLEQGLNYTASYQDEKTTWDRVSKGRGFVVEVEDVIVGTVLLTQENYFTNLASLYISQLAVANEFKGRGFGTVLMNYCEGLATTGAFEVVQLDTAKPAHRLVAWYLSRGYSIVGEKQWTGKSYESWIFEKRVTL